MRYTFLEQSRRDKTREAQVTPHKRSAVWGLLILTASLLAGCNGDKLSFVGDYSYKLSGEVELKATDGEVSYRLLHRNGQMNILKDKSQKNRYLITVNEMNGGCYTMYATLDGDKLQIDRHEFTTNVLSTSSLPDIDITQEEDPTIVYRIAASGGGTRNGDILIIKEEWQGAQSGNPDATIRGAEMTIIAERN